MVESRGSGTEAPWMSDEGGSFLLGESDLEPRDSRMLGHFPLAEQMPVVVEIQLMASDFPPHHREDQVFSTDRKTCLFKSWIP